MLNGLTPHFFSICVVAANSGVSISAASAAWQTPSRKNAAIIVKLHALKGVASR
jgi:hypothetical protein